MCDKKEVENTIETIQRNIDKVVNVQKEIDSRYAAIIFHIDKKA